MNISLSYFHSYPVIKELEKGSLYTTYLAYKQKTVCKIKVFKISKRLHPHMFKYNSDFESIFNISLPESYQLYYKAKSYP